MGEFIFKKITNFLAFIGIICCALSIIVGNWVPAFNNIAAIIALLTTAICAFFFVISKRSAICVIAYSLAVVVVFVFKFWTILG